MGKRIIVILTVCVLALAGGRTEAAYAATIKSPYLAEQAMGKAPDVKVYMTGQQMNESVSVTGTVGDTGLEQNGEIVRFDKSDEGIYYIILMDNSGSVNEKQFNEAKKQLIRMRQSLRDQDKMLLYTVGTTSGAGEKKKVFERTEGASGKKGIRSDCGKINKIKYMNTANSMTVLYRSLNEVLAGQVSPEMRTVVLLITDGEDDSAGKDIDKVSTEKEVKNASVPVYGVLLHRQTSGTDRKVSYTKNKILAEKTCRGYYYDCSTDTETESVKKAFSVIGRILKKETYVVNLAAKTNRTVGKEKLKLAVNGTAANEIPLDYSDYVKDEVAPSIAGEVSVVNGNTITFSIQDEYGVNLADANELSRYSVKSKKEDREDKESEDGKVWPVESVNAAAEGHTVNITLTMKEDFYTDEYTVRCSGIRDQSQDENAMDETAEFSVTEGRSAKADAVKKFIRSYWWIGLFLLVVVIGLIVIRIIRKKEVKADIDPDEMVKADRKLIRLTITDRAGTIKDVEWDVEGSLFVGRSNICNIYFDDDRLSKQHFVIEVNKMGCYISDLDSTNGTFVNGVKMTNRRMLLDGDVITAGREKIVFHVPAANSQH